MDCSNLFYFEDVTVGEVWEVIFKLNNSPSRDVIGMNARMIKHVAEELILPLTSLFNQSIDHGYFPRALKAALVTPVFKKGDNNDPSNFRPISIVPIVSKIFEQVLKKRIVLHLDRSSLFSDNQFGFRRNLGTIDALLNLTSYSHKAMEQGEYLVAKFIDLTKAFDCVDHAILLAKLQRHNFSKSAVALIDSYLQDRTQAVKFRGSYSSFLKLDLGVPQGSVLGPLLYIIYVNELPEQILDGHITMYADDTTIAAKAKDFNLATAKANVLFEQAERWFSSHGLFLNAQKTHTLVMGKRALVWQEGNQPVKILGVQLDGSGTWSAHCHTLRKKLSSKLHLLRNLKGIVDSGTLINVYWSCFHSDLSYCILAWGHAPSAMQIFRVQRKALRILGGLTQGDCRMIFVDLNILTLPCTYILQCLLHIKKKEENFNVIGQEHGHNLRSHGQLAISYGRLKSTRDGVNYHGVKCFNHLPLYVRNLPIRLFKLAVKKYLLTKAFYSVEEYLNCPFI